MLDDTVSSTFLANVPIYDILGTPTPATLNSAVHDNDDNPVIVYAGEDITGAFSLIKPAPEAILPGDRFQPARELRRPYPLALVSVSITMKFRSRLGTSFVTGLYCIALRAPTRSGGWLMFASIISRRGLWRSPE